MKASRVVKKRAIVLAVGLVVLAAQREALVAQPIVVPNGSFELQSGASQPFGINFNIDSWERPANPGYPEGPSFQWFQSAGAFVGTFPNSANPYTNLVGEQAAYILSLPGAGLFQDNQSTDWSGAANGLNATFDVGNAYQLTVGVFGKLRVETTATQALMVMLYYRNGANMIPVGLPATAVYSDQTFNPAGPFGLVDYTVTTPVVQAGDPWAGQNIGIGIFSIDGDGNGYWDMDNVRLAVVPEPGVLALGLLGLASAYVAANRRLRRQ